MDDQPDTHELRIQVSEAQTQTRFAEVIGKFDTSNARMEANFQAATAALTAKIEANTASLNARMEANTASLNARMEANTASLNARMDASFQALTAALSDLRNEARDTRALTRTWGQWTIGTVIVVGFGLAALCIGLLTYGQGEFDRALTLVQAAGTPAATHALVQPKP